jgi:hypothetical protein
MMFKAYLFGLFGECFRERLLSIAADLRATPLFSTVLAASHLLLVQAEVPKCAFSAGEPPLGIYSALTDKGPRDSQAYDFHLDRNTKEYKTQVFKLDPGYNFEAVLQIDRGAVPTSYSMMLINSKVGTNNPPPKNFVYHLRWGADYNRDFYLNGLSQCKVIVTEDFDYDLDQPKMSIHQLS